MRAVLALVLFIAGCHSDTKTTPAPVPASATAPPREVVASAAVEPVEAAAAVPAPPSAVTPTTTKPLPSETALRAIFKSVTAGGIVAAASDGQREAFELNSRLGADQPLLVASFTKLWVAVATLRYVARKELALDDEIRTLVPELKGKPWADSTVRELLSHTSRVPEFDDGFFRRTDIDFTHAATTLATEVSAATEKRGSWKYRNSEYAILGAILESKSGESAAKVLAREVFDRAGMKHAGVVVKGRPTGVDFLPMGRVRPENFFTAGNGYASVNDLLTFYEALQQDVLLDAESKKVLFAGDPRHDRAALGCWAYPYALADGGTTLLVERPGGFGNVKLVTVFSPEERRALVFWTGDPLDVGKPRKKDSIAWRLAHAMLEP